MKMSKKQREILKYKYGGNCSYCGVELGSRWQCDHFKPVIRTSRYVKDDDGRRKIDGKGKPVIEYIMENPENDVIDNMMPSCCKCNNDKSSSDIEQWRKIIKHRLYTLNNNPKYASYQKAKRYGLVVEVDIPIVFWYEKHNSETTQLEKV